MSECPRLLLLEPDASMRLLLQAYLETAGFDVHSVASMAVLSSPDCCPKADMLVLANVSLPQLLTLRQHSDLPVVVLSDGDSPEELRLQMLEAGADEYLSKPLNPRELVARCRAMLRRFHRTAGRSFTSEDHTEETPGTPRFLCFDGYCLDTVARHLLNPQGQLVELSGGEYQLLMLLLDSKGQVVSRETIANMTRGRGNLPMDRFIDVQISRLRRRLAASAPEPQQPGCGRSQLIKTVRGQGYVLAADVQGRDALNPGGISQGESQLDGLEESTVVAHSAVPAQPSAQHRLLALVDRQWQGYAVASSSPSA